MSSAPIQLTPEAEKELFRFMRVRGVASESEAICLALHEALQQAPPISNDASTDFRSWVGLALRAPQNPNPRFRSDDDLYLKP